MKNSISNEAPADVALVLGAGYQESADGTGLALTRLAEARVARAVALWHLGSAQMLLFSGGSMPFDSSGATEAGLMRQRAIELCVPENGIALEDKSTSTVGNFAFSSAVLEKLGAESVIAVSHEDHAKRSSMIGSFVGSRAGFEFLGVSSVHPRKVSYTAKELFLAKLTEIFLSEHTDTDIAQLPAEYDAFKQRFAGQALKKTAHGLGVRF